jgi:hypothetical protein
MEMAPGEARQIVVREKARLVDVVLDALGSVANVGERNADLVRHER